jgi:hypothetical protein
MNVCSELCVNLIGEHANFDSDTRLTKVSNAATRNFFIWVDYAHHNSFDAGVDDCLCAGTSATCVIARFKRRIYSCPCSISTSAGESLNFGVRAADAAG